MKKLTFLLLFSMLRLDISAQEVILNETFDAKDEAWSSYGNDAVNEFKDGNLILKGISPEKKVHFLRSVVIDPGKDFTISCHIKINHGVNNKSFGIILIDHRLTKKSKWYYFKNFPANGFEISVLAVTDSKTSEYFPKRETRNIIKASPENNMLELKNTGGVYEYFINDQLIWSKKEPDICISRFGFFSEGIQEVEVEDLVIKQNGWHDIKLVGDSLKTYLKENLGENVNSAAEDLSPVISADGKTLYMCVDQDSNNLGKNRYQDIWYSTLQPDNSWSKRVNLGSPLNNESSNAVKYVSPDNNTLYVNGRYDESGKLAGDGLSVSSRQGEGWGMPVALKIDNYYNWNRYSNAAFSPTGKAMVLSIERDDTFGGLDLYVAFKKEDGTWTEPRNMGSEINTTGSDGTPFIAADNSTLYFASDARPGYGNRDIYMTRRLDDTWTRWSEPKNMGPNINTPGWDGYFTIPASGEYCYLVSNENSLGKADIFRVKVSEASKPNPVALIKGQVYNLKTNAFLETGITYLDLDTNQEIGTARSNPVDGTYQISLPSGHKYSYYAQKEGYYPVSENIDLMVIESFTEITKNLYLAPIEVGQNILLNNIFFEYDKSELLESSVFELDRLVKIMNDNPKMVIQIAGHTDNQGTDAYNQKLSEDRARAVSTYLKGKNLGTRVSSVGFGKSNPVAENDTEEGRAQNRRVEFRITGK